MKWLLIMTAALALAGCGGNDGTSIPNTPSTSSTSTSVPIGLWSGTATASGATYNLDTLVLSDGQYYSFYGLTTTTLGMVSGKLSTSSSSFSDTAGVDLNLSRSAPVTSSTSGTFTSTSISGTEVANGQSLSFALPLNTDYTVTSSLTYLTGTWTSTTSVSGSFTFASNGTFTGALGACSYSGSLAPSGTTTNVYSGTVTYLSTGCPGPAGTPIPVRGFITRSTLFFGGLDSTNSYGVVFAGQQ